MKPVECDVRMETHVKLENGDVIDHRTVTEKYQGQTVCHHCGKRFEGSTIPLHAVPTDVVTYRLKFDPKGGGRTPSAFVR